MTNETIGKQSLTAKILAKAFVSSFVLISAAAIFAQDKQVKQYQLPKQPASESVQANAPLVVSPDEDYLIGASDVIDIKIEDAPELSGTFRLNAKGLFALPVVGQVAAEKKTTEQVARMISDKLRGGYLTRPIVSVTVKQSNSRAFFIQGAVRRPGIYQIEGHPSLLKLITIAGGLADNYGSTAFVMREKKKPDAEAAEQTSTVGEAVKAETAKAETNDKTGTDSAAQPDESNDDSKDEPEYALVKANINNLLRGNLEQNVIIEPGDIVHIPTTDVFFVAGEVKGPGSFPLKEGTTLRQAISLAQGTTFEGNLDQTVIFREDRLSGKRDEIKVDLKAVMSGKKEDIDILPNDIIIVPNSKKKAVTKSLLKTLGSSLPRILLGF